MTRADSDIPQTVAPYEQSLVACGAIAGLMYLGSMALFIGLVAPHMPPMDASAAEQATFYAAQAHNPIYTLIRFLIMAQLAPLPLFFSALFSKLRRAEGGDGILALTVLVAGVLTTLITPLVEMIEGHLLLGLAAAGGDPVVTRSFDGMTPISFALSGFPQAIVLGSTAILLLHRRIVPTWIGWFGAVLAVVSLFSTGTLIMPSLFFVGTLSAILFKVWLIILSIALLRRPQEARQPVLQQISV